MSYRQLSPDIADFWQTPILVAPAWGQSQRQRQTSGHGSDGPQGQTGKGGLCALRQSRFESFFEVLRKNHGEIPSEDLKASQVGGSELSCFSVRRPSGGLVDSYSRASRLRFRFVRLHQKLVEDYQPGPHASSSLVELHWHRKVLGFVSVYFQEEEAGIGQASGGQKEGDDVRTKEELLDLYEEYKAQAASQPFALVARLLIVGDPEGRQAPLKRLAASLGLSDVSFVSCRDAGALATSLTDAMRDVGATVFRKFAAIISLRSGEESASQPLTSAQQQHQGSANSRRPSPAAPAAGGSSQGQQTLPRVTSIESDGVSQAPPAGPGTSRGHGWQLRKTFGDLFLLAGCPVLACIHFAAALEGVTSSSANPATSSSHDSTVWRAAILEGQCAALVSFLRFAASAEALAHAVGTQGDVESLLAPLRKKIALNAGNEQAQGGAGSSGAAAALFGGSTDSSTVGIRSFDPEGFFGDLEQVLTPSTPNDRVLFESALGKLREAVALYGQASGAIAGGLQVEAAIRLVRLMDARHEVWKSPLQIAGPNVQVKRAGGASGASSAGGTAGLPSVRGLSCTWRGMSVEAATRVTENVPLRVSDLPQRASLFTRIAAFFSEVGAGRKATFLLHLSSQVQSQAVGWGPLLFLSTFLASSYGLPRSIRYPPDFPPVSLHSQGRGEEKEESGALTQREVLRQKRGARHRAATRLTRAFVRGLCEGHCGVRPDGHIAVASLLPGWSSLQGSALDFLREAAKNLPDPRRSLWYTVASFQVAYGSKDWKWQSTALKHIGNMAKELTPPLSLPPVLIVSSPNGHLMRVLEKSQLFRAGGGSGRDKVGPMLQQTQAGGGASSAPSPVFAERLVFFGWPAIGAFAGGESHAAPFPFLSRVKAKSSLTAGGTGSLGGGQKGAGGSGGGAQAAAAGGDLSGDSREIFLLGGGAVVARITPAGGDLSVKPEDALLSFPSVVIKGKEAELQEKRLRQKRPGPLFFFPGDRDREKKNAASGEEGEKYSGQVEDGCWVAGEKSSVCLWVRNPLGAELLLDAVRLVVHGVRAETYPISVIVAPGGPTQGQISEAVRAPLSIIEVNVRPLEAGRLFFCGVEFTLSNLKCTQLLWRSSESEGEEGGGAEIESWISDTGDGLGSRSRVEEAMVGMGLLEGNATGAQVVEAVDGGKALRRFSSAAVDVSPPIPLLSVSLLPFSESPASFLSPVPTGGIQKPPQRITREGSKTMANDPVLSAAAAGRASTSTGVERIRKTWTAATMAHVFLRRRRRSQLSDKRDSGEGRNGEGSSARRGTRSSMGKVTKLLMLNYGSRKKKKRRAEGGYSKVGDVGVERGETDESRGAGPAGGEGEGDGDGEGGDGDMEMEEFEAGDDMDEGEAVAVAEGETVDFSLVLQNVGVIPVEHVRLELEFLKQRQTFRDHRHPGQPESDDEGGRGEGAGEREGREEGEAAEGGEPEVEVPFWRGLEALEGGKGEGKAAWGMGAGGGCFCRHLACKLLRLSFHMQLLLLPSAAAASPQSNWQNRKPVRLPPVALSCATKDDDIVRGGAGGGILYGEALTRKGPQPSASHSGSGSVSSPLASSLQVEGPAQVRLAKGETGLLVVRFVALRECAHANLKISYWAGGGSTEPVEGEGDGERDGSRESQGGCCVSERAGLPGYYRSVTIPLRAFVRPPVEAFLPSSPAPLLLPQNLSPSEARGVILRPYFLFSVETALTQALTSNSYSASLQTLFASALRGLNGGGSVGKKRRMWSRLASSFYSEVGFADDLADDAEEASPFSSSSLRVSVESDAPSVSLGLRVRKHSVLHRLAVVVGWRKPFSTDLAKGDAGGGGESWQVLSAVRETDTERDLPRAGPATSAAVSASSSAGEGGGGERVGFKESGSGNADGGGDLPSEEGAHIVVQIPRDSPEQTPPDSSEALHSSVSPLSLFKIYSPPPPLRLSHFFSRLLVAWKCPLPPSFTDSAESADAAFLSALERLERLPRGIAMNPEKFSAAVWPGVHKGHLFADRAVAPESGRKSDDREGSSGTAARGYGGTESDSTGDVGGFGCRQMLRRGRVSLRLPGSFLPSSSVPSPAAPSQPQGDPGEVPVAIRVDSHSSTSREKEGEFVDGFLNSLDALRLNSAPFSLLLHVSVILPETSSSSASESTATSQSSPPTQSASFILSGASSTPYGGGSVAVPVGALLVLSVIAEAREATTRKDETIEDSNGPQQKDSADFSQSPIVFIIPQSVVIPCDGDQGLQRGEGAREKTSLRHLSSLAGGPRDSSQDGIPRGGRDSSTEGNRRKEESTHAADGVIKRGARGAGGDRESLSAGEASGRELAEGAGARGGTAAAVVSSDEEGLDKSSASVARPPSLAASFSSFQSRDRGRTDSPLSPNAVPRGGEGVDDSNSSTVLQHLAFCGSLESRCVDPVSSSASSASDGKEEGRKTKLLEVGAVVCTEGDTLISFGVALPPADQAGRENSSSVRAANGPKTAGVNSPVGAVLFHHAAFSFTTR
uniref:Uncharacterized protein n=1 Tax=Chromera velia CCMP2878 TaxID=1169474 RepID=A0A0G4FYX7_9ALVE|eukprot:Cvel_3920.t1-p1 / transcript=Cvel_3920.t1 / gene=Cvel_3920 / organism=Chromera_velia_CCMP2878 / gene_product=hypothetical protein / transcript_product=hypothetical protein / location=Cvel_scaffold166:66214-77391(+) / protein_length=2489 / sequence_SO=supercontig / SO=protein_coding / is_pseudo=false